MSEKRVIAFTKEELTRIKELQDSYKKKMIEFGDLKIARITVKQQWDHLNKREDELEKTYVALQAIEKTLSQELTTKYGQGVLNLDTGEFIQE